MRSYDEYWKLCIWWLPRQLTAATNNSVRGTVSTIWRSHLKRGPVSRFKSTAIRCRRQETSMLFNYRRLIVLLTTSSPQQNTQLYNDYTGLPPQGKNPNSNSQLEKSWPLHFRLWSWFLHRIHGYIECQYIL